MRWTCRHRNKRKRAAVLHSLFSNRKFSMQFWGSGSWDLWRGPFRRLETMPVPAPFPMEMLCINSARVTWESRDRLEECGALLLLYLGIMIIWVTCEHDDCLSGLWWPCMILPMNFKIFQFFKKVAASLRPSVRMWETYALTWGHSGLLPMAKLKGYPPWTIKIL